MSDSDLIIHPDDKLKTKEKQDLIRGGSLYEMAKDQELSVVAIDVSSSMGQTISYSGSGKRKIELMKGALQSWIKNSFHKNNRTRLGLVQFSYGAEVLIEITENEMQLLDKVVEIEPRGMTDMHDGLTLAIGQLKKYEKNRLEDTIPRILLISDGQPGSQPKVNAVIEKHKDTFIVVDVIYIGLEEKEDCPGCSCNPLGCGRCDKGYIYSAYFRFMKKIADATGGIFKVITEEKDFEEEFAKVGTRALLGTGQDLLGEGKKEERKGPIIL